MLKSIGVKATDCGRWGTLENASFKTVMWQWVSLSKEHKQEYRSWLYFQGMRRHKGEVKRAGRPRELGVGKRLHRGGQEESYQLHRAKRERGENMACRNKIAGDMCVGEERQAA